MKDWINSLPFPPTIICIQAAASLQNRKKMQSLSPKSQSLLSDAVLCVFTSRLWWCGDLREKAGYACLWKNRRAPRHTHGYTPITHRKWYKQSQWNSYLTSHTLTSQSNKVGKINLLNQKPSTTLETQLIFKCQSHTNTDVAGVEEHFMFKAENTVREPGRYEGESTLKEIRMLLLGLLKVMTSWATQPSRHKFFSSLTCLVLGDENLPDFNSHNDYPLQALTIFHAETGICHTAVCIQTAWGSSESWRFNSIWDLWFCISTQLHSSGLHWVWGDGNHWLSNQLQLDQTRKHKH